ncbi:MAG: hypothetical protein PHU70_08555 [Dehalococcoidia bacterium]|nr:hypothetical protein [Dehalococcoidia bacterium]MDD5647586.1 hypothetical protein [Dehalococcoidia bacterium]
MEIASYSHAIATGLGFVCAMVCAALMLNLKTDEQRLKRARIARRIAPFTWIAFIALIVSGIFLTLDKDNLNAYVLGVKHLLVVVLLVDAVLIHFRYFPRFFKQIGSPAFAKTYTVMRRIGALSVSCWIIILVLSVLLDRL